VTYIYDPELVAHVCHEANRAFQIVTGDESPSPRWEDAPAWQTSSMIKGVQFVLEDDDETTPEQIHESWYDTKIADGWVRGDVKDAEERTHPGLVPYDQLSDEERRKDDLFLAVVTALSDLVPQPDTLSPARKAPRGTTSAPPPIVKHGPSRRTTREDS